MQFLQINYKNENIKNIKMQFDNFIDQRIANEVELLKKKKDRITN